MVSSFTSADAPPALDVLRYFPVKDGHIDIAQEIGTDYEKFRTLLLEDKTGNNVKNIKVSERDDPLLVTVEILCQWLQGKGKEPVTWQRLMTCLQAADLNALAENITHYHNTMRVRRLGMITQSYKFLDTLHICVNTDTLALLT